MSIQSEVVVIRYAGNHSVEVGYPVPFKFFRAEHLKVAVLSAAGVETILDLNTDFTVSGAGEDEGGEILTTAPWDHTNLITIGRVMPNTQPYSYDEGASLPMRTLEENFDWVVMLAQQLAGVSGPGQSALRFPFSEPASSPTVLPTPSGRKDSVLYFNPTTGFMEVIRMDQLAQRLLVILGAEAVLPYRTREVNASLTIEQEDVNTAMRVNLPGQEVLVTLPETTGFSDNFFAAISDFGGGGVRFVAPPGVIIDGEKSDGMTLKNRIFGLMKPVGIHVIGVNRWWIYGDLY